MKPGIRIATHRTAQRPWSSRRGRQLGLAAAWLVMVSAMAAGCAKSGSRVDAGNADASPMVVDAVSAADRRATDAPGSAADAARADVARADTARTDTRGADAPASDSGQPTATADAGATLPRTSGTAVFAIAGRTETAIDVIVPTGLGASPPLVIAFHPTGGEPSEAISDFGLDHNAVTNHFIAIAPRAGYRAGVHPGDVDHAPNGGDSSWNMWTLDLDANEDLRYVRALIDAAHATYNVDTTRVYTMGFSNGAFFSYFVAASMPDRIAGFAENSGGWATNHCPTTYDPGSSGNSFQLTTSPVPDGTAITCAQLFATAMFPTACEYSASNLLRPPAPGARLPFGYLAHYASDDTVSVQWSCYLAQALGARAQTTIRFRDTDGTQGHNVQPDAFDLAWRFFAGRSTAD